MNRQRLFEQLAKAWTNFKHSYAELSDAQLMEPGVTGRWSVRDIIAHVTTWEEEALKYLPLILEGKRPPLYSHQYGGVDAFNALMTERKKHFSLAEVLRQSDENHHRLLEYLESVAKENFSRETRFRRRLRADTYGHYPKHARAILQWREQGKERATSKQGNTIHESGGEA